MTTAPQPATTKPDPLASLLVIDKSNVQHQRPIVLLKGPPGTGKTHNIVSWPEPIVLAYTDKNRATVNEAIEAGKDIRLVHISCWSDWADVFVPAVENRQIQAATIAVDTLSGLTKVMWPELQGSRDKLRIQDFGTGLDRMVNTTAQLCSAAVAWPDKAAYNIVMSSHTSDSTDDSGSVVKTTCAMMGAFKDVVEGIFDYVFLTASEIQTTIVNNNATKSKRFFCHTIPPNRYHTTKAPGYFPAEIGNTYADLQAALALNPNRRSVGVEAEPDNK